MTLTATLRRSPAVKRAVQAVTVTAGRLTSPWRMTPGFLIIGGQRCGTTSLYRTLASTPRCSRPCCTRACTTSTPTTTRAWPGTGPTSRCSARPTQVERRARACARRPSSPARTTCSTRWPPSGSTRDLPGVKVIVLLRDPVERAYSAHAHELARGFEDQDFETALALEDEPARRRGRAADRRPDTTAATRTSTTPTCSAAATSTTSSGWRRCSAATGSTSSTATGSSPSPSRSTTTCWSSSACRTTGYPTFEQHNARPRSPMPAELRERLEAHFEPYDERLASWLGHPVSWR